MKKQVLMTILVLSILTLMPITSKADYPSGTLGYSDEIAVGNEYEWTVSKFEFTGYLATIADSFQAGNISLSAGAKIKIVVLEDPDTASGVWYDLYVDGVKSTDPEDFYLGAGPYYSYNYGGFISPVTYTNATGTYGIYEQLFEEVEDESTTYSDSYSSEVTGVTIVASFSVSILYELVNSVFAVTVDISQSTIVSGAYEYTQSGGIQIRNTINTQTGLLGMTEMIYDIEAVGYTGKIHVLIDSNYANTPFSWAFSFLGLTVLAAVVGLVRRKRR